MQCRKSSSFEPSKRSFCTIYVPRLELGNVNGAIPSEKESLKSPLPLWERVRERGDSALIPSNGFAIEEYY
jgi:hypothetical protein